MATDGATQRRATRTRSAVADAGSRHRASAALKDQRARPERRDVAGQDADEERQPRRTPWVQRKVPQVHRGRIDRPPEQMLEEHEHGRDRHAGEELHDEEGQVRVARVLSYRPGCDAQPDRRPGEEANCGCGGDAAEQQQRRR